LNFFERSDEEIEEMYFQFSSQLSQQLNEQSKAIIKLNDQLSSLDTSFQNLREDNQVK